MKSLDIECVGYAVKADVYEGASDKPVVLSLIGRTSHRKKRQYVHFFPRLADELGITSVVFDYSGHGDSPYEIGDIRPAQHALEVVTVYDWIAHHYSERKIYVIGSSYGGYMTARLFNFRHIDGIIFRAPAMYNSDYFYTKLKDQSEESWAALRRNRDAMAAHPFLRSAGEYEGEVLLLTHENDELITVEVTDTYREAFHADEIIVPETPHSLDGVSDEKIARYNQIIYDWLAQRT